MTGEGNEVADTVLTVLTLFAAFSQLLCVHSEWAATRCITFSTLLRSAGWFVLAVRFSHVMATSGDLPVSTTSIVALGFLALAEITAAALNQRGMK